VLDLQAFGEVGDGGSTPLRSPHERRG
jgi:hypothetical protein